MVVMLERDATKSNSILELEGTFSATPVTRKSYLLLYRIVLPTGSSVPKYFEAIEEEIPRNKDSSKQIAYFLL